MASVPPLHSQIAVHDYLWLAAAVLLPVVNLE